MKIKELKSMHYHVYSPSRGFIGNFADLNEAEREAARSSTTPGGFIETFIYVPLKRVEEPVIAAKFVNYEAALTNNPSV